jgi:hypothetical protein
LEKSFETFRDKEAKSWEISGIPAPPPELLVKPSGSFSSPIAHRLNQPSFTTHFPNNGETADLTNPCIAMVMGTAHNENSLLFDQIHRRDFKSHGSTHYPAAVRQVHQDWTSDIAASSEAKIELIYGKKAYDGFLASNLQVTQLPLWGPFRGVNLLLVHEECYCNAQEKFKFRRAVVYAHHPQRLFYDQIDGTFVTYQEGVVAAAAAVAGLSHVTGYYQKKRWYSAQETSQNRHLIRLFQIYHLRMSELEGQIASKQLEAPILEGDSPLNIKDKNENDDSEDHGYWEKSFLDKPLSNKGLSELLPAAIDATSNCEFSSPDSFPPPVFEWWERQKPVLFFSQNVSGLQDILKVFKECRDSVPELNLLHINETSLSSVLRGLMEIQKQYLESHHCLESKWSHLVYARFHAQPVLVKCAKCGSDQGHATNPKWAVNRPGHFVQTSRSCKPCDTRTKVIPYNGPHVIASIAGLESSAPRRMYRDGYKMLLMPEDQHTVLQKQPIATFCLRCKGDTITSKGDKVLMNQKPEWTVGEKRHLYLCRTSQCLNCKNQGFSWENARYIPVDAQVESISQDVLTKLAKSQGNSDEKILSLFMDNWPPTTRVFNHSHRQE